MNVSRSPHECCEVCSIDPLPLILLPLLLPSNCVRAEFYVFIVVCVLLFALFVVCLPRR